MPDLSRPCIGCLDSRQCWVCSGTGYLHPIARRGLCERCAGTGVCDLCATGGIDVALRVQEPAIPAPRAVPTPKAVP